VTGETATISAITARVLFADGEGRDVPIHQVGTGWWVESPTTPAPDLDQS
jgi:hypothetical protein